MAYSQATEIQDLLRESANNPKMQGVPLASLARAWLELERLKREIRMQPKPKPIDVAPRAKSKRSQSFSDPIERAAKNPPTKNVAQPLVSQPATPTDAGNPPPPATLATEEGEHPAQPVQPLSVTG